MCRYQRADQDAVTALVGRVTPLLRRYFLLQYSNRTHIDDLLQDTWMRIHKARHTYRGEEPLLPWVLAVARHAGLDHYRRASRHQLHERQMDTLPEAAVGVAAGENLPDLDRLLSALPERQREVIIMLKVSGMTIDEVALSTSSSPGSVKQKAHRAYRKLREILSAGRGAP